MTNPDRIMFRILWGVAVAGAASVILAITWGEARAHSWFEGIKDPVLNIECCDNRDCVEITDTDVMQIAGGYVYKPLDDGSGSSPTNPGFVPDNRILPSQSYGYAVCIGGGGSGMYGVPVASYVRCFFAPSGF